MDFLSLITFGLGGVGLILMLLLISARSTFLSRIDSLTQRLDRTRSASEERTDLPAEVLALAHRLSASSERDGRLVQLWRKPGSKPLPFTALQTIAVAEVGFLLA
jgi:hypothetical protein